MLVASLLLPLAVALALALPAAARADDEREGRRGSAKRTTTLTAPRASQARRDDEDRDEERGRGAITAFVPPTLLAAAEAEPRRRFRVIVQASEAHSNALFAAGVRAEAARDDDADDDDEPRRFRSLNGAAIELSGRQLLRLARKPWVSAITPDSAVRLSGSSLSNRQKWPHVIGAAKYWSSTATLAGKLPTIAVVDSGVDPSLRDFSGRSIEQVTLTQRLANSPGDGRGHGSFVASIAAGAGAGYAGVAPTAPILSIDVVDDHGIAYTSDVIAAADWILANHKAKNIRVANFSLHATNPGSFLYDPLNKAVQRLWFAGVVVVAAAGNYGVRGEQRGVPFAPGNDPFVITVGASDIDGSIHPYDDFEAPWSAGGYTLDGFAKPELGAPGRYLVGAVPPTSTLAIERPERVVAPGYMQLSGTSFSAPMVAGSAAVLLALHPEWTPGQVKGALMMTAKPTPDAAPGMLGVGEMNLAKAAQLTNPPNPNLALERYVTTDPQGGDVPVFDAASWVSAAQGGESWDVASWTSASWTSASWTSASWTSASWTSASWTSASWTSASWTSASWTSASWTSASWTSASWTSASWTSASWTSTSESDASWVSNAEDDANSDNGYWLTPDELVASEAELGLDLNGDGVVGATLTVSTPTPPEPDASPTADAEGGTTGDGDGDSDGGGDSDNDGDGDDVNGDIEIATTFPATTPSSILP